MCTLCIVLVRPRMPSKDLCQGVLNPVLCLCPALVRLSQNKYTGKHLTDTADNQLHAFQFWDWLSAVTGFPRSRSLDITCTISLSDQIPVTFMIPFVMLRPKLGNCWKLLPQSSSQRHHEQGWGGCVVIWMFLGVFTRWFLCSEVLGKARAEPELSE